MHIRPRTCTWDFHVLSISLLLAAFGNRLHMYYVYRTTTCTWDLNFLSISLLRAAFESRLYIILYLYLGLPLFELSLLRAAFGSRLYIILYLYLGFPFFEHLLIARCIWEHIVYNIVPVLETSTF